MSISLNNHETRIKKLEDAGSGSWSVYSNSNGYCLSESGTGLKIQFGTATGVHPTITFPKSFTTICCAVGLGIRDYQSTTSDGAVHVRTISLTSFRFDSGSTNISNNNWIAIGMLYTYRYINNIFVLKSPCKNLFKFLFRKEV